MPQPTVCQYKFILRVNLKLCYAKNMQWWMYTVMAIAVLGTADFFRKLASGIKDPVFTNLLFQAGAFTAAIIIFMMHRKTAGDSQSIAYALIGGALISIFSLISFKALSLGPVSVVWPAIRVGGLAFVVILGIFILREKLSFQTVLGFAFATIGIYLLLSHK